VVHKSQNAKVTVFFDSKSRCQASTMPVDQFHIAGPSKRRALRLALNGVGHCMVQLEICTAAAEPW